ncbi:uncharacterized protein LOC144634206 [Oculina patagonica]
MKSACVVLGCLLLSSGASGKEKQPCGMYNFYCPLTNQCFDRKIRCTGKVCLSNGTELNCFPVDANATKFPYVLKKTLLSSKLFKKSKSNGSIPEPYHWFVEYRGFAYEFGPSDEVEELDMNEDYKYGPDGGKIIISKRQMGISSCSRKDIKSFNDMWEKTYKYHWWYENCQDYVRELLDLLGRNCRPKRNRRQVEDDESLPAQCYQEYNSSLPWKLSTLLSPLILFAVFYNVN